MNDGIDGAAARDSRCTHPPQFRLKGVVPPLILLQIFNTAYDEERESHHTAVRDHSVRTAESALSPVVGIFYVLTPVREITLCTGIHYIPKHLSKIIF